MTFEQAVKRVERYHDGFSEIDAPSHYDHMLYEALRLVLAAVKKPRVYALGEEERKALGAVRTRLASAASVNLEFGAQRFPENMPKTQAMRDSALALGREQEEAVAALTAAISLEQPEEPFTVEELLTYHSAMLGVRDRLKSFPQEVRDKWEKTLDRLSAYIIKSRSKEKQNADQA